MLKHGAPCRNVIGAEIAAIRHRRRKILKTGGAQYTVARIARAKNFRPRPLMVKPRPFLHDRSYCDHAARVLDERTNSKSSRVDLAATYSHIDS